MTLRRAVTGLFPLILGFEVFLNRRLTQISADLRRRSRSTHGPPGVLLARDFLPQISRIGPPDNATTMQNLPLRTEDEGKLTIHSWIGRVRRGASGPWCLPPHGSASHGNNASLLMNGLPRPEIPRLRV